jgi:hypothetical protein
MRAFTPSMTTDTLKLVYRSYFQSITVSLTELFCVDVHVIAKEYAPPKRKLVD